MNPIAATITTMIVLGILGFIALGLYNPPLVGMILLTVSGTLTLAAVWGLIYGMICNLLGE